MDNEKRQALSVYRMEQAEETLTAAKMCLEYHLYKDCINRSYYVAFYAVKAVLAIEGVDFKRHKDAVAYFNKMYVASGKVSREVGKRLGRIKTAIQCLRALRGIVRLHQALGPDGAVCPTMYLIYIADYARLYPLRDLPAPVE